MKTKWMRILTAMLVMLLAVSVFSAEAFAADDPSIVVGNIKSAEQGESIEVPVSLENSPAIASFTLLVEYDDTRLSLDNAVQSDALTGTFYYDTKTETVVWFNTQNVSFSQSEPTLIFTLTFSVLDDAPSGDAEIKIAYDNVSGGICDFDENNFDFAIKEGLVTVSGNSEVHVHTWDNGKITKEPTCTETGVKTYTCTDPNCGETKTETIAALGHDYGEWVITKEANCGEEGLKSKTCTRCGDVQTEAIPKTGEHTWNDGVITTEPTCTKEGVKTYTCTVCGETKTEAVPTIEHTPDGNTDCEKATYCTVCGAVIKPAGEHDWDDGKVTTEPTCTETGIKTFTCNNCGATKTEVVEALGHELTYAANEGTITETCTRCDHTATATVTAENAVYTGDAIENAQVKTSDGWLGGEITVTYENNVNAGTATAKITVEGVTASVEFTISKATEYTITLGNLSQYTNNLGTVTATVEPKDETAVIVVEYGTDVAEVPCNHEHTEECGEDGIDCAHVHDEECGYAAASTAWSTTAPTAAGEYHVRAHVVSSENLAADESYVEGTLTIIKYVYPDPTPSIPSTPTTVAPKPETTKLPFIDVHDTDWFYDAVTFVYKNGLMNGYDETTFAPNDNLSRAMLMTIIARIDGVDTEGGENWYEVGMAWAVENGITDGSNPLANITREQLVTMLYRYVGSPEVSGTLNFKDVSEISGYAVDAMTWAVQNGILKGTDVGTLNPQNSATRAEAAAILARFCEKLAK